MAGGAKGISEGELFRHLSKRPSVMAHNINRHYEGAATMKG
jgi:hypothetical protein